jgi:hypothetical protein
LLSIRNNADLLYFYKMCYEAKFVRGQPITTFYQLRAVAGQFIRFAVVCGDIRAKEVSEAGSVFTAITNLKTVKGFVSYFQLRCASSTVLNKAFNLKTLPRMRPLTSLLFAKSSERTPRMRYETICAVSSGSKKWRRGKGLNACEKRTLANP